MIVADTSFLYALLDGRDDRHADAARWYARSEDDLVTTPLVLAEVDHLAGARAGARARRAFRRDVAAGALAVEWWRTAGAEAAGVAEQHEDLGVDLTDTSLVALAARLGTVSIATFDERHFRVLCPLAGASAFRLLPADAD